MATPLRSFLILSPLLLLAAPVPAAADPAVCATATSLDGAWVGNDGGDYYVRVDGDTIWWVGVSGDLGNSWTNLFHGTRTGDAIIGNWVDVNGPMGKGSLMLHVGDNMHMDRSGSSGSGFGGTEWHRAGCVATAQQPQPAPATPVQQTQTVPVQTAPAQQQPLTPFDILRAIITQPVEQQPPKPQQ
jgi:hypothetical protein